MLKWLPYIWKCHINSIVVCQIHLKFSGSQPTHSLHPPLWAQSAVSVSVITQALWVENGVFLIFCLVQFSYSELGWQLECCYTQLNPAIARHYTHCVLLCSDRERSLYTHLFLCSIHAATHTGTQTKGAPWCASLKQGLRKFTQSLM